MQRYLYSDSLSSFLQTDDLQIIGSLTSNSRYADELTQKDVWRQEIKILKSTLRDYEGVIFFEYSIPRMGGRIDVVLIIRNVIFVLEFKVGEKQFLTHAVDQVWDYALDLKNFHEASHSHLIAPVLIATDSQSTFIDISTTPHNDKVLFPIRTNSSQVELAIANVLKFADGETINSTHWASGKYSPTPSIIEAAMSLYNGHAVAEISRNDASAMNLTKTSTAINSIIADARKKHFKAICFITGVPGAGKTLVGLDIATKHLNKEERSTSVFLSGNGPLVAILREALTRDRVKREREKGKKVRKGEVLSKVKVFIQNVHHFRDEYLNDNDAPIDHVAIFDEAQRAWNHAQTEKFMRQKKGKQNFSYSEPEFLISCLDRHKDWAVVVCLVGGGQEINTGEAGIGEWVESLNRSFPHWHVYISDRLSDSEYAAGKALAILETHQNVSLKKELHLAVSMRSFRAEHVSLLAKHLLDLDLVEAQRTYQLVRAKYPICLTRDLSKAKQWLKEKARGTERYGIVVSSQAQRLKPHAIDVKSPMDPIHWFLDGKDDVRSSFYLEDVATEFDVQGLELDWTCITWDGDFRYSPSGWKHFSFVGNKWNKVNKEERQLYLKNAYRVLLTRARQGMVIVVPEGSSEDLTRAPEYYDETFIYLKQIGFDLI